MAKKNKDPRQYSKVTLDDWYIKELQENHKGSPLLKEVDKWIKKPAFIYLGEIPNMRGHCIVLGEISKTLHVGYHIEDFRELTEEEL